MKETVSIHSFELQGLTFEVTVSREVVPPTPEPDPPPDPTKPLLLVIVADSALANCAPEIQRWRDDVARSGLWSVEQTVVPASSTTDPQRLIKVESIRSLINIRKPAAIQIIGRVAYPCGGWDGPDGHGSRCFWSDSYFMSDCGVALQDRVNYGLSTVDAGKALWSNVPGDGRYDVGYLQFRTPCARLDFSEITLRDPKQVNPSGPLVGQPRFPAVDEWAALREYLDRNHAFRGLANPERTICFTNDLWASKPDVRSSQIARFNGFQPILAPTTDAVPRYPFVWCNGTATEHLYTEHNGDGPIRSVIRISWRSFTMERFETAAGFARGLQTSLVHLWGHVTWGMPTEAKTVADLISHSLRGKVVPVWQFALGDVSLPLLR